MMRTLFLNPPSFEGFDGGAGSRYQARREIRSFWYPTWLAQPAACVPNSKLIDAPVDGLSVEDVVARAKGFELAILHTSTPSYENDARVAVRLKEVYPSMKIGMVGPHCAVLPGPSLEGCAALDFVARKEFDFTIRDVADGMPYDRVEGISWRSNGAIHHNAERPIIENLDSMPHVVDVYKRDLWIEGYYIGYLKHPYLSLYTGRGCPARCTFCLWPQTVGGRVYRTRSPESVEEEIVKALKHFPQVKEIFFDDDTFTVNVTRAMEIARRLHRLGVTWSCNARANVPVEYIKFFKDHGLRLFLVGYESGDEGVLQRIRKGVSLKTARRFTQDCKKVGVRIHGTFILGLPLETRETIEKTIRFAKELDPHTIQVSLAAPYPGTELYEQALANGWMSPRGHVKGGIQDAVLTYPGITSKEIFESVERMYRAFYFRPRPIWRILKEMWRDPLERKRRLREGVEFIKFMSERRAEA